MNRNEIIEHMGADNWEMVLYHFSGDTLSEIMNTLNDMFPHDDNAELAEAIFFELS